MNRQNLGTPALKGNAQIKEKVKIELTQQLI